MGFAVAKLGDSYELGAKIIRASFITVANELKLTRETAPTNPAFIEPESLINMVKKGIEMYLGSEDDLPVAFVAFEKADSQTGYLEKVAVLPEYRHKGYGRKLMDFVFARARENGINTISIGIINENTRLKNWYIDYGFRETGKKAFPHLPFEVCFMEKKV